MKKKPVLGIWFIGLLVLAVFIPIYGLLLSRFGARESYYSHGYLVPFVSLYLVYRKRKALIALKTKPSFSGLVILIAGVVLYLVSLSLRINFTSYLAIPVVIFGIVLYLGGGKFAKELLFPIAFLIFMLPLPEVLIIGISFKLKMLAAQGATFLVNKMAIDAQRAGSTIYYPGGLLLVGDPCSGLRSLITFLALGALFTQFCRANVIKRSLLFISSVPIALLSNLSRLTFLLLVGYLYGEKATKGFLHDFSGIMVFILGFIGLLLVSRLLKCQLTV